jgi:hypothetical protein
LLPLYFWTSFASKISPSFNFIISAFPSIAMYKIVRISFTEIFSASQIWINGTILLSWIFVILILVGWRIHLLTGSSSQKRNLCSCQDGVLN